MTPTCGNCKFWERSVYADGQSSYGECNNDKVTDTFMPTEAADTVSHYSEYAPFLRFGEHFGCNQFSAKAESASFTVWLKRQNV